MRGGKITLYEGGHRVPCFIRWPAGGLRPPGNMGELTCCQDLLPTLIELCGLSVPPDTHFDGTSLAGLLRGTADRLPDRMLVVQFSRMDHPEPIKGDAAVLWGRWRLVKNTDLYDLRIDPGQKQDVAAAHPEVVRRMREHYERWWARVAPKVNAFSVIPIGAKGGGPVRLSACDWQDVFLDQQRQVRQGEAKSGSWGLIVEQPGTYEFELRRWPAEADRPIRASAPAHQGPDGTYPAGVALPITGARLRVGSVEESKPVGPDDTKVTFRLTLPTGPTRLQTWFSDADGHDLCGAYYVYVRPPGKEKSTTR